MLITKNLWVSVSHIQPMTGVPNHTTSGAFRLVRI